MNLHIQAATNAEGVPNRGARAGAMAPPGFVATLQIVELFM
jgi:hypothetical protein